MNCEHNFKMYWIIKETLHFATDEGEESIIYASVLVYFNFRKLEFKKQELDWLGSIADISKNPSSFTSKAVIYVLAAGIQPPST